ncbi:hypothetical protein BQ8794_180004 [Mesorhizobium prunaredense]|uniref:Uncharacterized protein n=1 Tax=Mesorhizobium prunaredense TaxID=1631249 RepID=A0A1R3V452_9HYPH|nr:hypothetical protein BQ8794_180004 [Mesorhizobium prunaredense]
MTRVHRRQKAQGTFIQALWSRPAAWMLWGERPGCGILAVSTTIRIKRSMSQSFEASRSLTALEQNNTIVAVTEMSKAKWLVPGFKRQPLK